MEENVNEKMNEKVDGNVNCTNPKCDCKKEKKSKKRLAKFVFFFSLLLVILATGTAVGIFLKGVSNTKKDEKIAASASISYEDVKGLYVYKDNKDEEFYYLELQEDGKFNYIFGSRVANGFIGNYTIEGNNIVLSQWFSTGTDIAISPAGGTITVLLNDDGTITDKNNLLKLDNAKDVILEKTENVEKQLDRNVNSVVDNSIVETKAYKSLEEERIKEEQKTIITNTTTENIADVIGLGYETIVIIINGDVYTVPVNYNNSDEFYNNYKITKINMPGKAKAVKQFSLGLEPSTTNYIIMEDGSVYLLNLTTPEKVVDASKKIVDIVKDDQGDVYAVSLGGEKTKIGSGHHAN